MRNSYKMLIEKQKERETGTEMDPRKVTYILADSFQLDEVRIQLLSFENAMA
jgi:hypothetical protein